MTTVEAPKRKQGRPTLPESIVIRNERQAKRALDAKRERSRKEDVATIAFPLPTLPKDPRGLNAIQRARYFAIKAAIITPGIERCAEYQGGRVAYIVKDRLLHQTDAMTRYPPHRPSNRILKWYSLTDAQITAAFGP